MSSLRGWGGGPAGGGRGSGGREGAGGRAPPRPLLLFLRRRRFFSLPPPSSSSASSSSSSSLALSGRPPRRALALMPRRAPPTTMRLARRARPLRAARPAPKAAPPPRSPGPAGEAPSGTSRAPARPAPPRATRSRAAPPAPLPGRGSHGRAPPLARSRPARRQPPGKVLGSGNKAWLGRELFARSLRAALPAFFFVLGLWVVAPEPSLCPPSRLGPRVPESPAPSAKSSSLGGFFSPRETWGWRPGKGALGGMGATRAVRPRPTPCLGVCLDGRPRALFSEATLEGRRCHTQTLIHSTDIY
nr:atherin-like [Chlorocebus sabaeus]